MYHKIFFNPNTSFYCTESFILPVSLLPQDWKWLFFWNTFNKRSLSKWKFGEISREQLKLIFCTLMGSFCPNDTIYRLKKVQKSNLSFLYLTLNSDPKFEWTLTLQFLKWHEEVGEFIRALRSLKNCTLMGSFCPKHVTFQLENFRGFTCHDTEE